MERNTDRGIWSVVILLIAVGMGIGLTITFPKLSEYVQGVVGSFRDEAGKKLADAGYNIDSDGRRNYLLNSDFSSGDSYWSGQGSIIDGGLLLEGVSGLAYSVQNTTKIPEGEYILQVWYEVLEGQAPYIYIEAGNDAKVSNYYPFKVNGEYFEIKVVVGESNSIPSFRYAAALPVDHLVGKTFIKRVKLKKGDTSTEWTPAPEDFNNLKGKSYALLEPLRNENILSLNGSFEEDDFIGLWLGNDKFVGFLNNQELTFDLIENYDDEFVVVKTLSEKGIIDNAKLEKGNTPTDVSGWNVEKVSRFSDFNGHNMSDEMVPTKFR